MENSATHPTTDRIAKAAHETVDKVYSAAGRAEERLRDKASTARDYTHEVSNGVTEFIRERPWTAVGIAALVGVTLGALIRR